MADDETYIGIDVGGTFLKAACVDRGGRIVKRLHTPIEKESAPALLGQLQAAVEELGRECNTQSVGLGLPAIVERQKGRVRNAPNVPVLNGLRVARELEERTGRAVFADNDANAAALAEAWLGAGRGATNVLFVTLGTGVGGGIVFDGRLWLGVSGYAGEIGHIQADPQGRPCGCGSWGGVETIAGIPGWTRRAEEAVAAGRDTSLRERAELDPKAIVEEAQKDDAAALEIVDGSARAVAVGIAATLNLLNLDRVVIGGGVSNAGPFLLDRIAEETRRRTFPHVCEDATFRQAELGSDAGVIGAARIGMQGVGAV